MQKSTDIRAGDLERLSKVFNALGNPVRLKILVLLRDTKRPLHIKAISRNLGVDYAAVYRHVEVLKKASLLEIYEVGRSRVLSLLDQKFIDDLLSIQDRTRSEPG
ncbi:MAG: ArsR/SmtB family transcription factor [Candidatus Bathyarchaeia archaeon]